MRRPGSKGDQPDEFYIGLLSGMAQCYSLFQNGHAAYLSTIMMVAEQVEKREIV